MHLQDAQKGLVVHHALGCVFLLLAGQATEEESDDVVQSGAATRAHHCVWRKRYVNIITLAARVHDMPLHNSINSNTPASANSSTRMAHTVSLYRIDKLAAGWKKGRKKEEEKNVPSNLKKDRKGSI